METMANTFTYKVKDGTGKITTGILEGGDEKSVIAKLRQRGYVVLNLKEKSKTGLHMEISLPFLGKRVKIKDLTIFSRQFATMINSGLSLTRSLGILAEQTKQNFAALVNEYGGYPFLAAKDTRQSSGPGIEHGNQSRYQ